MKLRTGVTLFLGLRTEGRIACTVSLALAVAAYPVRAQDTTTAAPDTGYVDYHESPISLPLGVGLRIPTDDRVNGIAIPGGPKLELNDAPVPAESPVPIPPR